MTTPYYNAGPSQSIPIVQGRLVSAPAGSTSNNNNNISDNHYHNPHTPPNKKENLLNNSGLDNGAGWAHGDGQSNSCKDVIWGVLFYAHLGALAAATIKYVPMMAQDIAAEYADGSSRRRSLLLSVSSRFLQNGQDAAADDATADDGSGGASGQAGEFDLDMNTILVILAIAGLAGLVLSTLAVSCMMAFPRALIKISLWFNIVVSGGLAVLALASGSIPIFLMALVGFLLTAYYAYVVWSRIPFAAANLQTAIAAIRSNMGLAFFAYNNLLITFLWSLWWSTAFVATTFVLSDCNAEGYCEGEINGFLVFLLLLSFFWTVQVIKNVVHVTVAGTVGTWWFHPREASSCCSKGVRDSYWRSITTSFGSICLGSLVVAIIQATREIVNSMRSEDNGLLLCLADCLLGCLESLVEYFNKWAYIYVGLYGYGFVEASKNVITLFKNRGWTAIIADTLVDTVLAMVCICVGLITGVVGLIAGSVMQQGDDTLAVAFLVGMVIGFILCSTLFSLISSGVNTVIVCFAEAPGEFQANHPQLASQMIQTWRQSYPNEFGY